MRNTETHGAAFVPPALLVSAGQAISEYAKQRSIENEGLILPKWEGSRRTHECGTIHVHDERAINIGDSFGIDGEYLGTTISAYGAVRHFWEGVKATGDIYVNGVLSVKGRMNIDGNVRIDGDVHINGDVRINGSVIVAGDVHISPEASLACTGPAEVKNIIIRGEADMFGELTVDGSLEVETGGRMHVGKTGAVTFANARDKRTPRLVVTEGGSVDVDGTLDTTPLASGQIFNAGGIWTHAPEANVNIFYDVYVYVNGEDRSQGELVMHGRDLKIFPEQRGKIEKAEVIVDGVALDAGCYTFDGVSVTVPGTILDGIGGEVDISVTSAENGNGKVPDRPFVIVDDDNGTTPESALTMLMLAGMAVRKCHKNR